MGKILIVDDDEDFLAFACAFVSSLGYEYLSATSRSDALRLVSECQPDCCILDIRLEDCSGEATSDGVHLFEELKSRLGARKAIFMSAHSDYDEDDLQLRGANGLLDKSRFAREIGKALTEVFYPRVLLVEDDYEFAEVASAAFMTLGVKCVAIVNPEEMRMQVAACDFSTFDVVIADAILSGEDNYHGWNVLQQIPPSYSRDSVFFLTGKSKSEIESHLLQQQTTETTREDLLLALGGLSFSNILDKSEPYWAERIVRACSAKEAANG